jgi:hypothetical protein
MDFESLDQIMKFKLEFKLMKIESTHQIVQHRG